MTKCRETFASFSTSLNLRKKYSVEYYIWLSDPNRRIRQGNGCFPGFPGILWKQYSPGCGTNLVTWISDSGVFGLMEEKRIS